MHSVCARFAGTLGRLPLPRVPPSAGRHAAGATPTAPTPG